MFILFLIQYICLMVSLQIENPKSITLFSYRFRYLGLILILFGMAAGYVYYFGGKPDFFVAPVFAMITSYLETRFFVIAQTNVLDELAAGFTICGFALVAFSKEKNEKEFFNTLRLKAFI